MPSNIIYKIDKDNNRVDNTNWSGHFHQDSTDDALWLYIYDDNNKDVDLNVGDLVLYSDYEIPNFIHIYRILECQFGIFRVELVS